jgi:hypothetical protein
LVVPRDLDSLIAEDWRRLRAIEVADADLSADQEDLLETVRRRLEREKPLTPQQRSGVAAIFENLHELTRKD